MDGRLCLSEVQQVALCYFLISFAILLPKTWRHTLMWKLLEWPFVLFMTQHSLKTVQNQHFEYKCHNTLLSYIHILSFIIISKDRFISHCTVVYVFYEQLSFHHLSQGRSNRIPAADGQTVTVSWIWDLQSSGYRTPRSPLNQPVDRIHQQTISQRGRSSCRFPLGRRWPTLTGKDIWDSEFTPTLEPCCHF